MKTKTTMVAVAMLVAGGCDVAPEGSEEADTIVEQGAGLTLSPSTLTTVPTVPIQPLVPAVMGSAVVGDGTAASCTETALDAALATAASITFNCGGPATIHLTTLKIITATQTIDGGGTVTLEGDFQTRLIEVSSTATLTLANITLCEGTSNTVDGGAIANHGSLTMDGVTVRNNLMVGRDAAGLFTDGPSVKIQNSLFRNNAAVNGGAIAVGPAAVPPAVQISNTQFTGNGADSGGAIRAAAGSLVVVDSAFTSNSASFKSGGAIFTAPGVVLTISGSTPTGVQFSANRARRDGAAIFAEQSTVSISNAAFSFNRTTQSDGDGHGGAIVNHGHGGSMSISNGLFFQNQGRFGGALASYTDDETAMKLTIDRTSFQSNASGVFGGAIYVGGPMASAVITNSAFDNNTAVETGGALMRIDAQLRIESSSFTHNSAAKGGALTLVRAPMYPRGPYVRIQNVTIASNSATTGGVLQNLGAGLELYSTTIAANVGGGVLTDVFGNTRFRDTVLQNPGASNCALIAGSYSDDGANFATDTTCQLIVSSSSQGTALTPGLGALTKDPNGLTSFMKAGRFSPLLDRGLSCTALDQIGAARSGACDIGAVESGVALVFSGGVFTQ